jgi:hypothetical protein
MYKSARKQNDERSIREFALRSVLTKTNNILGYGGPVVFSDDTDPPAPAWTNGKNISIAARMDPVQSALRDGFTPKSTLITTALNYHELSHNLFTPRMDSNLVTVIRPRGLFQSFNILEDQAAETKFVSRYHPARHYFTALVTNYMLGSTERLENNYVLVSGRLFLPPRFRKAFRDSFSKPEILDDIDRLVAAYKKCSFPGDQKEMLKIIEEFDVLLYGIRITVPWMYHDIITEGSQVPSNDEEYVADETEETDAEAAADPDDGKKSKPKRKSKGEADSKDVPKEEPTSGAGGDDQELVETLNEILDETIDDLEEELEEQLDTLKSEEKKYESSLFKAAGTHRPPSNQEGILVDRCVDEFRLLREKHAPGWHVQQRSGKLDHRRFAQALRGSEEIYRRWNEGINDAMDFEVVFLLDTSGSMSGHKIGQASSALWVLARSFEECGGTTSTFGFGTDSSLLVRRAEDTPKGVVSIYRSGGGTNPVPAIDEARRIFDVSTKPLKLLVFITDGEFNSTHAAEEALLPVTDPVVFIGIENDVTRWNTFGSIIHTQTITDPMDLIDIVRSMAIKLSNDRLKKGTP